MVRSSTLYDSAEINDTGVHETLHVPTQTCFYLSPVPQLIKLLCWQKAEYLSQPVGRVVLYTSWR